ncbi:N-acyl homoserine lactonase family protein [Paenibacillus sp. P26]|nr:N-acyl homoserine lactonase family protein [Paenibacillus sp. P26]
MNPHVKVHILHCGKVIVDRRLAYKDPEWTHVPQLEERTEENHLTLPVSCYLIEHPEGDLVIDAGWSDEVRMEPERHLGFASRFCRAEPPPGQSVTEQLALRNRTPEQIRYVLISHLDVDHISGSPLLKGAGTFLVSGPELRGAREHQIKRCGDIRLTPFELEPIPYGPYGLGKDVYGDGTVYLVHTPGHTAGLTSVLARVEGGWLLLVSDAAYSESSWSEPILPGNTSSDEEALSSLEWIREFSRRDDCLAIIANHDPSVQERTY